MGRGLSTHDYVGGIFSELPVPFPHEDIETAINLSHEIGHQALMVYQRCDRIIHGDLYTPVYSPIRETMRPAIMSIHANVASLYIVHFLEGLLSSKNLTLSQSNYASRRLVENKNKLSLGVSCLSILNFTPVGKKIISELKLASS